MDSKPKLLLESNNKSAYDELFERGTLNPSEADLYRRVAMLAAQSRPGGRALDVGCGLGYMADELSKAGLTVSGLDFSQYAIGVSQSKLPTGEFVRGTAEDLPWPDRSFDVVTCMGSLENFPRPEESLAEMRRVVKTNGRAYILLPNSHFLGDFINVLVYGTPKKNIQPIERFLSRVEWEDFLFKGGFAVKRASRYNEKRPIIGILHAAYAVVRPFIPLNLAYHFLFECEPR